LKKIDITSIVKPNISSLHAYEIAEIPCKVKLDANESPYIPYSVQRLASSVRRNFQTLNRYPDLEAKLLRKVAANSFGVRAENILHGNGSDELISYLVMTFGGPVLYPVPTFSMYGIIAQALGEKKVEIPLDREFDLDIEKIHKAIKTHRPKLIFLSSPNNPTGNCFSPDKILTILDAASSRNKHNALRSLVVVDEAYQPFSRKKSFMSLLKKHKNLVVLRTLSKVGFAGLRVGFLVAEKAVIKEVNKVRLPFNLNAISQTIASDALKDRRRLNRYVSTIVSERNRLYKELDKIVGVRPYPSDANFILFKVRHSDTIYKRLMKQGVLVRNMNGTVPDCLRVTVGTPRENSLFLRALKKLME
jgi:histidinol-phosphate aminotransferase